MHVDVSTDALRVSMGSVSHIEEGKRELVKYVYRLAPFGGKIE